MGIGYIAIFAIFAIFSLIVSNRLKSKFKKYSKVPINNGLAGKDIAAKMLNESGIYDVSIVATKGRLSDHYNPTTKTVALSHDVYY